MNFNSLSGSNGIPKHEQNLFDDIVEGLKSRGWRVFGGNNTTFIEMHRDDAAIKIFRDCIDSEACEYSKAITVRYSAEPENV